MTRNMLAGFAVALLYLAPAAPVTAQEVIKLKVSHFVPAAHNHHVSVLAPWVEEVGPGVEVLAEVDGRPVLAREGRFLVAAFHPELTDDTRLHEQFLEIVREETSVRA